MPLNYFSRKSTYKNMNSWQSLIFSPVGFGVRFRLVSFSSVSYFFFYSIARCLPRLSQTNFSDWWLIVFTFSALAVMNSSNRYDEYVTAEIASICSCTKKLLLIFGKKKTSEVLKVKTKYRHENERLIHMFKSFNVQNIFSQLFCFC